MPTGTHLANAVQAVFSRVRADALRQAKQGRVVDLSEWVPTLAQAAIPFISSYYRRGQRDRARELIEQIKIAGRTKSLGRMVTKAAPPTSSTIAFDFNLFRPEIAEFVRTTAFEFAKSTLATASVDATKAYELTRAALAQGLPRGESYAALGERMFAIFGDVAKANRIAMTESVRAMSAGQYQVDIDSKIVGGTRWLASSDACDLCLSLMAKGPVPLGTPFHVWPKAPARYKFVFHPPGHPGCFCSSVSVMDFDNFTPDVYNRLRGAAFQVV